VDVVDAASGVPRLWSGIPSGVQKRLQNSEPRLRPVFRADPGQQASTDPLDGFAVRGLPGLVCDERAFHYLLGIERRRSDVTQRPFFLMLIECDAASGGAAGRRRVTPAQLLPIVCNAVRETDFVGWYRQNDIVGAALTQDGRPGTTDAGSIVRDRMVRAVHDGLSFDLASQVRVRLYEVLGDDELRAE
jgi:hypothetical protein